MFCMFFSPGVAGCVDSNVEKTASNSGLLGKSQELVLGMSWKCPESTSSIPTNPPNHVAGIALKVAPCCNLLKKGKEKTILCEMFAFLCLFYHRWIDGHIMIYHGYIRLYHILHSVFAKCYVCFINSFLWCISKCVGQLLSGFSRSVELCTR